MSPNDESWSAWFRSNFDKIILWISWLLALGYASFLIYGKADPSNVAWGREIAGTLLGAFLGLVTGSRIASSSSPTPTNQTVPTVGILNGDPIESPLVVSSPPAGKAPPLEIKK